MMKQLTSISYKEQGFTLLESLVGLMLFSIVILGSGAAISKMLTAQKDLNTNFIIINMMQSKLQNALNAPMTGNICDSINKDNFTLGGKTYYTACSTIEVDSSVSNTTWPILAVSQTLAEAQSCVSTSIPTDHNCYIVGR